MPVTKHIAIAVFVMMFSVSAAHAGSKWTYDLHVYVNADGSGSFDGDIASARSGGSSNGYLGCSTITVAGYAQSDCYAYDGETSGWCITTDPTMVDIISKTQGDQRVTVYFDSSGWCTYFVATTSSVTAPKTP